MYPPHANSLIMYAKDYRSLRPTILDTCTILEEHAAGILRNSVMGVVSSETTPMNVSVKLTWMWVVIYQTKGSSE